MSDVLTAFAVWLSFGFVGYIIMRQGFLVEFEESMGKALAWTTDDMVHGFCWTAGGPVFLMVAIMVCGKSCFKRRAGKANK